MRNLKMLLGALVVLSCSGMGIGQTASPPAWKNPGDALNIDLDVIQQQFVSAADAMPEDKFSFAPTNGDFKGVRTFAQEVKHVAATNYYFGGSILGEKPPVDRGGENGPDSLRSKAEIMKFLNDSFAYLHKAIATITAKNELELTEAEGQKVPRISVASFAIAHPLDHYGQMVEYLRMNEIIPPASRPQQGR